MSKIGKINISIPEKVKVALAGNILNIEDMTPYNTKGVTSAGEAKYAIEVNQGWFDSRDIKPGDRVEGIK